MKNRLVKQPLRIWLTFALFFGISLIAGAIYGSSQSVQAAPGSAPQQQTTGGYAGPEACGTCHTELFETWSTTRHAQAFSSPIFQRDWQAEGSNFTCLECHTTGYNPDNGSYSHEGVTCESCHGSFQPGHPQTLMPITPDEELPHMPPVHHRRMAGKPTYQGRYPLSVLP